MTADQEHRRGQVLRRYDRGPARRPRDVTPTIDGGDEFERAREAAEQYACEPPPYGCAEPAGSRCRVIGRPDLFLTRQPAHLPRLRKAGLTPPSTVGDGARRDTDRPPGAPIPERNRALYDDTTPAPDPEPR